MPVRETQDPGVVIEAGGDGWVRYRNLVSGRRWEVHGYCDGRGDCIIGSVIRGPGGTAVQVRDHQHLAELRSVLGRRLGFERDSPVTPEFSGCCPFEYTELAAAR